MKLIALASAILLAFSTVRATSDRQDCSFVDPAGNTIKLLDFETHVIKLDDTASLELTGYVHLICNHGKINVFQTNASIATSKLTSITGEVTIAAPATTLSITQLNNVTSLLGKYFDTRSLVSLNDDQKSLGFLKTAMTSLAKSDGVNQAVVYMIMRSYYNAYSTGIARYTLPVDDTQAPNAAIDALLQFIAVVNVKNGSQLNYNASDADLAFTSSAVPAKIAVNSAKTTSGNPYNVNLIVGDAHLVYNPNPAVNASNDVQSVLVQIGTPKFEKKISIGQGLYRFISDIYFTGNYVVAGSVATKVAPPLLMTLVINSSEATNTVRSVYFNNSTKLWTDITYTHNNNNFIITIPNNDAIAFALVSTTNNNDFYDNSYFTTYLSQTSNTLETLNTCLKHASMPTYCWKCDAKSTTPLVQNITPFNYITNSDDELGFGKCVDVCPEGLFNDNSTCLRCPFGATKCDSFTKATACIADFSLSNGKCIPSSKVKFPLTKRFVRANKNVNASFGEFTNPQAGTAGFVAVPVEAMLGDTFRVTCASFYTSGEETLTFKHDTHKGFYWESDQKCVFDKSKINVLVDSLKSKTTFNDVLTILEGGSNNSIDNYQILADTKFVLPSKDSSSLAPVYNILAQLAYGNVNLMNGSTQILNYLINVARNVNSANTDQVPSADIETLVLNIFKVANSKLTNDLTAHSEYITDNSENDKSIGYLTRQEVAVNAPLPVAVTTTLKSAVTSANYFNLSFSNFMDPLALIPINMFTTAQVMQMGALEIYAPNTFLPFSNYYAYGAAVGVQLFDAGGKCDSDFLSPDAELIWGSRVGYTEFNLVAGLDYSSPTCYAAFENKWHKIGAPEMFVSSNFDTVYLCKVNYKYDLVAAVGKAPGSFADILAIKGVFGKAIFAMTAVVLLSSLIL